MLIIELSDFTSCRRERLLITLSPKLMFWKSIREIPANSECSINLHMNIYTNV